MEIATSTAESVAASGGPVRLWLRLVGDFDAQIEDGRSVLPVSKKARALLALIAAYMPHPIRRELAASLLWSAKPKEHAANSLRQALRELQIALAVCGQPPILITGGGRLSLRPESVWIDVHDPAAIRWKSDDDDAVGPLLLCQNLQGIDPAFDTHLERVWKNLVFHRAFVPIPENGIFPAVPPPRPVAEPEARERVQAVPPAPQPPDRAPPPVPDIVPAAIHPIQVAPAASSLDTDDSVHGQGWRIAVLPFRSLGAPLEGGLSLGMAEEISAAMARFRMPRLVATSSFWDGSGPALDALARSRAYNLDYVISGTIQTSGPRIRVTVTLLDVAMNFEVMWASRFEGATDDLFNLQDRVASHTVAQIDPELLQRHQYRGEPARTTNAQAHRSVLAAIQSIYRPDKDRFMLAGDLLTQAIDLDPNYAAAHAWLAYWHIMAVGQGWSQDAEQTGLLAGTAAERAVALDPLDARGLTIAGHVKAYMLHDVDAALALHARAVSLNPNLPIARTLSAWSHVYAGQHEVGVREALQAISLSPSDPHIFFPEHAHAMGLLFLRELDKADRLLSNVLEMKPGHASAIRVRTAVLGHLGRLEEAAHLVKQLRAMEPGVTAATIADRPPLRPWDKDYYIEGLIAAGLSRE